MNENIITVTGNLCTRPELRQTRNGATMLTFRVASTHRYHSNRTGQWEDGVSNFYDVVAYRQLAFNAGKSLNMGDAVILQGQLKQRRYERQDGGFGMGLEIEARMIGPDLAYGVATFLRAPRPQGRGAEAQVNGAPQGGPPQVAGGSQGGWPQHHGQPLDAGASGVDASDVGASEGDAPAWVDRVTGEVRDNALADLDSGDPTSIDPDTVGFLVDKDDEETREFPEASDAEAEGELVGASD